MKNCPFCNLDVPAKQSGGSRPPDLFRRAWRSIQWLFPTTLLVLMPKCPMCVAAYVALFTGIGISVSTARWIQILMPVLCVMSLVYLAIRFWRCRRRGRTGIAPQS